MQIIILVFPQNEVLGFDHFWRDKYNFFYIPKTNRSSHKLHLIHHSWHRVDIRVLLSHHTVNYSHFYCVLLGSAFSKTKPKHGILTVLRLAVVRLILLPFYISWWSRQTCVKFSILLLLLYVLQIVNTFLYFTFMSSDDSNEVSSKAFNLLLFKSVSHLLCTPQSAGCRGFDS